MYLRDECKINPGKIMLFILYLLIRYCVTDV